MISDPKNTFTRRFSGGDGPAPFIPQRLGSILFVGEFITPQAGRGDRLRLSGGSKISNTCCPPAGTPGGAGFSREGGGGPEKRFWGFVKIIYRTRDQGKEKKKKKPFLPGIVARRSIAPQKPVEVVSRRGKEAWKKGLHPQMDNLLTL